MARRLVELARFVEPVVAPAGTTVVRQGDAGDCVYIVSRGSFGVFVTCEEASCETRVATKGPGEYLGEMALLSDQPRSATVRAEEDGELLRLERTHFMHLLGQQPQVALTLLPELCQRLRAANDAIARLADAARLMAENRLTREEAAELERTEGSDRVSRLSQAFGRMAQEVMTREEHLRQEVAQLRIEIDRAKMARDVAEITESDYFRELQQKRKRLRERRDERSSQP